MLEVLFPHCVEVVRNMKCILLSYSYSEMHTKDLNKDSGKTQGFLGGFFYPTHWYFFQTLWNQNMG